MYDKNDYRNYLEDRDIYSDDFLMHYGVKGMKWKDHQYVIDPRLRERMAKGLGGLNRPRIGSNPMFQNRNGIRGRVNAARRQAQSLRRKAQFKAGRKLMGSQRGRKFLANRAKSALNRKAHGIVNPLFDKKELRRRRINSAVEGARSAATRAASGASSRLRAAKASAQLKGGVARGIARNKMSSVSNRVRSTASSASNRARLTASSASNRVRSNPNVQNAVVSAKKARNKARAKASRYANQVKSSSQYKKASSTARRYANGVSTEAKKAYNSTRAGVSRTYGNAKRRVSNAYGSARSARRRRSTMKRLNNRNW